jgi:Pectate lyase superfamily protein
MAHFGYAVGASALLFLAPSLGCSSGSPGSAASDAGSHDGGGGTDGADSSAPPDGKSTADTGSPDVGASEGGIPTANLLPPDRVIDWSRAGVIQKDGTKGIPSLTTVCATVDASTYGNGTTDASPAIQKAVDGCPAGQVVFLPAGTYLLKEAVTVSKPIVLRGAGPTTKIVESANIQFGAYPGSQPSTLYEANWTGGLTQGSTVITLDDTSHLSVGQVVVLDQLNDTNVTTSGYVPLVNPTGNEGVVGVGVNDCASRDGLSFCTDGSTPVPRALMQLAEITAIAGKNVTLDRPVYYTHDASLSPQAFFWEGGNLSYAGIESLRIDAQYNDQAIAFGFCTNCWAKGIEVDHIARGAVSLWYDDHFEFRDSYLFMNMATAPENYGVEIDDTGASLFENNIFDTLDVGLVLAWSSNGNVSAYNYSVNEDPGSEDLGAAVDTHSVHTFMNLYEGNTQGKFGFDYVWGSTSHQTLFRNRMTGYLAPIMDGSSKWSNGNWPIILEAWNRVFNLVGNVLGTDGVQNGYEATTEASASIVGATGYSSTCMCCSCGMGVAPIYVLGFWNSWQPDDMPSDFDPIVVSTLLRWGNYDYYSKTTHWDAAEIPSGVSTPTTKTLPASFYLASKPSWFGSAPFPLIGPDVAGYASASPAELCYKSRNLGSGGTFDASKCY